MTEPTRRYSYPLWGVVSSTAVPLGFTIAGVALLPHSAVPLRSVILALQRGQTPQVTDLRGLLGPWVFILAGLALLRLYTEIIVTTTGLKVRVYEHRKTGETFVVPDPGLRLDELEQVQQEVIALLGVPSTNAPENVPPAEHDS